MLRSESPVATVTLADAIARRLTQHGVEHVFGIPGTHNLELFRSLGAAGIEVISAHHEQGLGYAADAYSRVSSRPAVVVTTTGPGITNLITALATSLAASVPVLAIAPGIPEGGADGRAGWLHDLPSQLGLMSRLVRSRRAQTGAAAVSFIDEVARSWQTERPLPAYLEVPFDRFTAEEELILGELPAFDTGSGWPAQAEIDRAAQRLVEAERPVIVAGRGGANPEAAGSVRQIAEALGAPVMTTANAKGVLDETHPLSLGVSLRVNAAKQMLERSDAVLVVGSDLGSSEFWGPCPALGETMIRVDVDAQMMHANAQAPFPLLGRSELVMPRLAAAVAERRGAGSASDAWEAADLEAVAADLAAYGDGYRRFHEHVQDLTDSLDVAIAGDSSQVSYFGTATYWKARRPNRFLYPAGYGTLGYAIPAAIGAVLAGEVDRVVAVTGEGGMLFSVQELATAAELGLPVVTIVFTNGGYQEIRDGMDSAGIAPVGVSFTAPDFVSLARGFRIEARSVVADGMNEIGFREALEWALAKNEPTLIEVDVTGTVRR